jgi:ferredoxin
MRYGHQRQRSSCFVELQFLHAHEPARQLNSAFLFLNETNWNLPFATALARLQTNNDNNSMADKANRYPENVAGKYYVDNQCIDCDLCRETAPDNFKRNEDGGYSYLFKQPDAPEEEARCKEAKEGCPVEAIGDDGA